MINVPALNLSYIQVLRRALEETLETFVRAVLQCIGVR